MTEVQELAPSVDITVDSTVNYGPSKLEHGSYQYNKILPITGGQLVTLGASNITETLFEIPTKVINLARSVLSFDLALAQPDAGSANYVHADGIPFFNRLSMYTRGGVYLADLNHANYFSKMVTKLTTPVDEFMQYDGAEGGRAIIGTAGGSATSHCGIQPCRSKAAGEWQNDGYNLGGGANAGDGTYPITDPDGIPDPAAAMNLTLVGAGGGQVTITAAQIGAISRSALSRFNALSRNGNFRPAVNGAHGTVPQTEPRYLINTYPQSAAGDYTIRGPTFVNYKIPLSAFVHSVLALDKGIAFPEVVVLRIEWAGLDKIAFKNTAVATATGAAVLAGTVTPKVYFHPAAPQAPEAAPIPAVTGPLAALPEGGSYSIRNLEIYLACETSRQLIQDVYNKINSSGLSMMVPFTYCYKNTTAAAGSCSLQQRLNSGHGRRLLRVYYSAFKTSHLIGNAGAEIGPTLSGAYDNYTLTSQTDDTPRTISNFYTSLDNERLTPFNLEIGKGLDYMVMKPLLKGSLVTSQDIHRANHVYCDDWTSRPLVESKKTDLMDAGIDLSTERLYSVFVQEQVSEIYDHYMVFVCQRMLTIAGGNISML